MLLLQLMLACPKPVDTPEPTATPKAQPAPLRFQALDTSALSPDQVQMAALAQGSPWATPQTGWHPLRKIGEQGFGALAYPDGSPFMVERRPFSDLCNEADFNALTQHEGGVLWLTTHMECSRGAIAQTRIEQSETGELSAVGATTLLDSLGDFGGVYTPCAGVVTAWNTHLSSEEYEPDARDWDPETQKVGESFYWNTHMIRAFQDHGGTHPYRYGWVPEITLQADGSSSAVKHYSMGRLSHEIALVASDERTTYMSDDGGQGVGFYMFIAETAQRLDSGTLYAAKWLQEPGKSGGKLSWVNLGVASDAQLAPYIEGEEPVLFSELFVAQDPNEQGLCAEGLQLLFANGRPECLALAEPGRFGDAETLAMVASRLETRRYAALMGATVELEKGEGIAYLQDTQELWLALSGATRSMTAGNPVVPEGYAGEIELDQLSLPASPCGGVYGGKLGKAADSAGDPILSSLVLTRLDLAEGGAQIDGELCPITEISNPDNITAVPGQGLVFIAEDTGLHTNNLLWAWQPASGEKVPVLSVPTHAEVTGISWVEVGDYGYLLATVQHPNVTRETQPAPYGPDSQHMASVVGYLGPFKLP